LSSGPTHFPKVSAGSEAAGANLAVLDSQYRCCSGRDPISWLELNICLKFHVKLLFNWI
jgi:hypothetical protein